MSRTEFLLLVRRLTSQEAANAGAVRRQLWRWTAGAVAAVIFLAFLPMLSVGGVFVLSSGFSKVLAVVCTYRLSFDLPLGEDKAQQRLALRTKKMILRLIGFHVFDKTPDHDPRSLSGPTLSGVPDLDHREDTLRFPLSPP